MSYNCFSAKAASKLSWKADEVSSVLINSSQFEERWRALRVLWRCHTWVPPIFCQTSDRGGGKIRPSHHHPKELLVAGALHGKKVKYKYMCWPFESKNLFHSEPRIHNSTLCLCSTLTAAYKWLSCDFIRRHYIVPISSADVVPVGFVEPVFDQLSRLLASANHTWQRGAHTQRWRRSQSRSSSGSPAKQLGHREVRKASRQRLVPSVRFLHRNRYFHHTVLFAARPMNRPKPITC